MVGESTCFIYVTTITEQGHSADGDDTPRLPAIFRDLLEGRSLKTGSLKPALLGFMKPASGDEELGLSHERFRLTVKYDGHVYSLANLTRARSNATTPAISG